MWLMFLIFPEKAEGGANSVYDRMVSLCVHTCIAMGYHSSGLGYVPLWRLVAFTKIIIKNFVLFIPDGIYASLWNILTSWNQTIVKHLLNYKTLSIYNYTSRSMDVAEWC